MGRDRICQPVDQNELANHFMKSELGALLKAARDLDKDALTFIHEQSGSPFDPQVVDLFFRVFES